jgi:hypothetical protein
VDPNDIKDGNDLERAIAAGEVWTDSTGYTQGGRVYAGKRIETLSTRKGMVVRPSSFAVANGFPRELAQRDWVLTGRHIWGWAGRGYVDEMVSEGDMAWVSYWIKRGK